MDQEEVEFQEEMKTMLGNLEQQEKDQLARKDAIMSNRNSSGVLLANGGRMLKEIEQNLSIISMAKANIVGRMNLTKG